MFKTRILPLSKNAIRCINYSTKSIPVTAFKRSNLTPLLNNRQFSIKSEKLKNFNKTKFHEDNKNISKDKKKETEHSGKSIILIGILAIATTIISFSYQKGEPEEFVEEMSTPTSQPEFTPDQVKVIFVLGGPGAGKGTQCAKLVADYGFVHLSAGDLLRAEQQREGSEVGTLIKHYITEGLIVPQEITIQLLKNAISENYEKNGKKNFLVDGFPRKMDQAITFEEVIVPSKFILFFDCPESVMLERLLERSKTSGRADDNIESIKKRFKTFEETSMPVVQYFEKQDKVVKVCCDQSVDKVYEDVKKAIEERII